MGVVNTISLCPYHESFPIPWVHVYTMSPCQNNESMSIPWVHVCIRIPILYHESMSIPGVFVKSMLPFLYHENYSFQIYRNKNNKNKKKYIFRIIEIQLADLQKYINTEITVIQKYKGPKGRRRRISSGSAYLTKVYQDRSSVGEYIFHIIIFHIIIFHRGSRTFVFIQAR